MMLTRTLPTLMLTLALSVPAAAAPKALNKAQVKQADATATSLYVHLDDASIGLLRRFPALRELRLTGPYDNGL